MLLGALVNVATFGAFTFLAPVVTGTAGLDKPWISVALALFGMGSFVGVTIAGRLSDRHPGPVLAGRSADRPKEGAAGRTPSLSPRPSPPGSRSPVYDTDPQAKMPLAVV